jgi:FixJ family two-component response regulator
MMPQPTVVIVVDDNAGMLRSVVRLLARHGIDSRAFASAEALLESDSVQTATCLLLDIHLGGLSGFELRRRLAASGSKCPVIFMTWSDQRVELNICSWSFTAPRGSRRIRSQIPARARHAPLA